MKSRGAYETPGGTLLVKAHQELERLTIDRETAHFQQALSLRYAELVYYGLWFAPLREALDAFFNVAQLRVTGAVGLKLWKGTLNITSAFRLSLFIARTSPVSPWAATTPRTPRASSICLRCPSRSAESKGRRN